MSLCDGPTLCIAALEPGATSAIGSAPLNLCGWGVTQHREGHLKEAVMTHWQDRMVDRPEPDYAAYATGWTISGLAILATVVAVWILGI